MSQHFDVAVIGTQRAGLVAAALMAKRGARVLLVDHGERTTYRRRGLQLPLVPELIPHVEDSPHVRRVTHELGIAPKLRATVASLVPGLQALLPDHRIDLRGDGAADLAELCREFPDVAAPLRTFLERLTALDGEVTRVLAQDPPLTRTGLRDHFRVRKVSGASQWTAPFASSTLFDGIPEDHPVRELLLSPLAFYGHLAAAAPSMLQGVRILAAALRGAVVYPDRLGGLSALLLQAALDSGVEVRRGAVVSHVALDGRTVTEIQIENDRLTYAAETFVAATAGPFHELLPTGKVHAKIAAEAQAVRPVASLLTLNLVVERSVIPKGMGEAVMLLNGRREPRHGEPGDPPVLLRRYPAQRGEIGTTKGSTKSLAVPECEVISLACPAPLADMQRSPERLSSLKSLLFERAQRVIPFLELHLRDRSHPIDTSEWDMEGEDRRRVDPLAAHPFFVPADEPWLGVGGRSPLTSLKNLIHCGADVVPGLGVEGDFAAGLTVAGMLSQRGGKRWPAPRP